MSLSGTEIDHQYQDDLKRATDHDHHSGNKPPSHSTSNPAVSDGYLSEERLAAAEKTRDESATAKARQIYMRAGALRRRGPVHPSFSAADAALHGLTRHIGKSIPARYRASSTILSRFWFLIHYKVAVFALHQAHRQVHRLGLTRVEDKSDFLAKNCRWYLWFCSFSQFISSRLFQQHKELI